MIDTIRKIFQRTHAVASEKTAVEAYELWSATYDSQPGNLMLDLDEEVFSGLLSRVDCFEGRIADIGCGTGRHWHKLYAKQPAMLIGFDVSAGMLGQLSRKFPHALVLEITDNKLEIVPDRFAHCVVSTLTIAHIENISEAIAAWCRILKPGGDLIITDFHPDTLAVGGRRSFRHNGQNLSVVNYVHPLSRVKEIFAAHGLTVSKQEEICIGEEHKHYYTAQHAVGVYEKFRGMPVIYGLHLKKAHAAE